MFVNKCSFSYFYFHITFDVNAAGAGTTHPARLTNCSVFFLEHPRSYMTSRPTTPHAVRRHSFRTASIGPHDTGGMVPCNKLRKK